MQYMISYFFLYAIFGPLIDRTHTYEKDAKPIFKQRCAQCHNANWSNKNWLEYDIAYRDRFLILQRLEGYTMPPNGFKLPKKERQLLIEWINQGGKK